MYGLYRDNGITNGNDYLGLRVAWGRVGVAWERLRLQVGCMEATGMVA